MALLESRSLQVREDWKFALPVESIRNILRRISSTHAVVWNAGNPFVDYRTLYFDSAELRCFHDHRRGRPIRYKIRYRDYLERETTRLEIKVHKPRGHTLKLFLERPFLQHTLVGADLDFVQENAPFDVGPLESSLSGGFSRVTLVGEEHDERITIDHGLWWERNGATVRLPRLGVVEVKAASRRAAQRTLRLLADLGHRPGRMSKYCVGVALTDPSVRANRLRPTIRGATRIGAC